MTDQGVVPSGLTDAQAAEALLASGPNSVPAPKPPTVWHRVGVQLRDPMILLLIGAALLTVALRDFTDLTVILVVIVLNTTVGVVQEVRAEHALAALGRLAAPRACVLRSGRRLIVPAEDLVRQDVTLLAAGDIVPADIKLFEAVRLQVDEAALTGESVPVEKEVDGEVLAGTVITRGRGSGTVLRVGHESALGRIAELISTQRPRPTPLQIRLAALSRILSVVALSLSVVVAVVALLNGLSLSRVTVTAVSLTVAAVPESLPAVVTLALAIGAHRMAHRAAVVRRLPAVETLGSVTVVATDKTGTLTEGIMEAERVWTATGQVLATGHGYNPEGRLLPVADPEARRMPDDDRDPPNGLGTSTELHRLLRDVVLCNDAGLRPPEPGRTGWQPLGDPTEAALLALAHRGHLDPDMITSAYPRTFEIPFDSSRKRMATFHRQPGRSGELVVVKGAPEVLLAPGVTTSGEVEPARVAAGKLARAGYRVLAVADRELEPAAARTEDGLRLAGLVAITDPIRANAATVTSALATAGVQMLLITGDAAGTATTVARQIGLPAGEVLTSADLDAGADPAAARVFARIRPEHKLDIIRAWQDRGEVVAMTGDGVNDAPALRRADIGVAMGRDGTEVARQAADLILTDDDLGTVVSAIEEGRRIYSNIRTFLRYALSGGLAEVLVMLAGPAAGLTVPLLPAQILWINMLTHGLPGVAIGAEPADPKAMRRPPRPPAEQVLGAGLWQRVAWTGALIAVITLAVAVGARAIGSPWQTMTYLVLGLAQLGVALALRRPRPRGSRQPRFLDYAVAGALVAQVAPVYVPALRDLLGLTLLSPGELAVAVLAASVPGLAVAVRRLLRGTGRHVPKESPAAGERS
ncbi:Ca2+-transporting ATPase [Kribbella amoyensis]|uniref:Ca2+-transporting ATPase n=1 Tax=Kribbella amoyensis TaxID=996641 RepID=A0A561C0B1_9ACTN|nr:cation-transporting P-type ATPase [Kribbella amoyensis]TWD84593.1 Ca2+-transporting ATPase [Kribbella amoyensis]